AAEVSRMESNIEHVSVDDRDGVTATLMFVLSVRGRTHLAKIIKRLRAMQPVIRIVRPRA
ncbi:MAG TPA: ACT domain-containing protein, partial [Gammaproteobacteria bacterium]|nr:ACT domain-containing protein [Gammaproteobacteria bacterium]HYW93658.1 ACT domain-containing protein [Gammaproteobacteria bacterium]